MRAHLDGCPACREEAAALAPVADLLPLVDLERVGAPPEPPPPELLDEVLGSHRAGARASDARGAGARRGVGRRVAAALALVVVVAVARRSRRPAPVGRGRRDDRARPGVQGEAVVHEDPDATWVELTTSGLAPGETYAVWLEETGTGERAPMGTFTAVEGDLYISLYSTLPRDRAGSVGVSTPTGHRDGRCDPSGVVSCGLVPRRLASDHVPGHDRLLSTVMGSVRYATEASGDRDNGRR